MRLNAKRPSSVHVTKLNVRRFFFSIQTHITEKAQSKHVLGMCLNSVLFCYPPPPPTRKFVKLLKLFLRK